MNKRHSSKRMSPRTLHGFTLVELMIAMVLGLLVVGATIGVFLSNQQTYRINEGLSQIQESARTSFEILGREIRQAAGNACGDSNRVANVLNNAGTDEWATWAGIRAYEGAEATGMAPFGTDPGDRVQGTHAVHIQGTDGLGVGLAQRQSAAQSANLFLNLPTDEFEAGDILMVCDPNQATIFQVTNYQQNNTTVVANSGAGNPGNCSTGQGYPTVCQNPGTPYVYDTNATVAYFKSVTWYIGHNGRDDEGGFSLYRARVNQGNVVREEVVAGVSDMTIRAHRTGMDGWDAPSALNTTAWEQVDALELTLSFLSAADRITTNPNQDAGRLSRDLTHVIALRNRLP